MGGKGKFWAIKTRRIEGEIFSKVINYPGIPSDVNLIHQSFGNRFWPFIQARVPWIK